MMSGFCFWWPHPLLLHKLVLESHQSLVVLLLHSQRRPDEREEGDILLPPSSGVS